MKSSSFLIAIPSILLSLTAIAAGNHSGGHDNEAVGKPGVAAKVTRTVSVDMTDNMRFSAAKIDAKQGETIRFVVKNSGKVKHEMVLGTAKELKEHSEVMKKNPEMEHADANMVTVAPGKTGEIIWQFTKAGKVAFACLQPGHYDAGMKGVVKVSRNKTGDSQGATMTTKEDTNKTMPVAGSTDMVDGEIRKIDTASNKITIKHGEIKNLDMPGMTMVFQVKDPAMLETVKTGDKVRFKAEKSGGAIVVTNIEKAK